MGQFIHRYVFYNCYKELCGIVGLLCMKNYVLTVFVKCCVSSTYCRQECCPSERRS